MSFQIMTHTPEQEAQWTRLATSNPGRVVRALRLGPLKPRTAEGDTMADIYPILSVLSTMTLKRGPGGTEKLGPAWRGLVKAGVINALCMNVLEMVNMVSTLPDMPADLARQAKESLTSVYMMPMKILVNVMMNLADPPTASEMDQMKTITKHWTKMMKRVWEEPENTLLPGTVHELERYAVSAIDEKLLQHDPSGFLPHVWSKSDTTIQVLARFWAHSDIVNSMKSCGTALCGHLRPEGREDEEEASKHVAYTRTHRPASSLLSIR